MDGLTLTVGVALEDGERLGRIPTVRVAVFDELFDSREDAEAVLVAVLELVDVGLAVVEREGPIVLVPRPEGVLEGDFTEVHVVNGLTVADFVIELERVMIEEADADRLPRGVTVDVVDAVLLRVEVDERVDVAVVDEEGVALTLGLTMEEELPDFDAEAVLVVVRVLVAVRDTEEDAVAVLVGATVIVPKLVAEAVLEGFTLRVAKRDATDETDATELPLGFIVGTELRVEVDVLVAVRLLVAVNVGNTRSLSNMRPRPTFARARSVEAPWVSKKNSVGGVVATIPKDARSKRNRIPTLYKKRTGQFRRSQT